MTVSLKRIIYDPIRSRILFDGLAAFFCFSFIWTLMYFFDGPLVSPFVIIPYTCSVIGLNAFFGVYGRLRTSHIFFKLAALSTSAFLLLLAGFFFEIDFFMILLVSMTFLCETLPRVAFAFTLDQKKVFMNVIGANESLPVLVVGGGGYIGSHVVEQLLLRGRAVRVFDSFQYGKDVLSDLVEKYPKLELVQGEISDIYKLTLALQGVGAVIHLAGIVGDPACAVDPELTRHVNIISTRILKESVKAFGIGRFIFASSCSVYGSAPHMVDETSTLHPVSLYAQTKIDSEREILMDTHDTFHPTVLRFATVFGHSRKPRFDLVANLFVAQAYEHGEINVTGASQWRPFIHVQDVARAVVCTLDAPIGKVSRQIFNVGGEDLNYTIGDLATLVSKVVKKSKKRRTVMIKTSEVVGDARNYAVSFAKIKQLLGFVPTISIEDGIRELHGNYRAGVYGKSYTDPYYSNLESTKELKSTFHTSDYQHSHLSVLGEVQVLDHVRRKKRSN